MTTTQMNIVDVRAFTTMVGGQVVNCFELIAPSGFMVRLCEWGASVLDIQMPDRDGRIESVVLGLPEVADYADNPSYFGTTIGRTAGRIAKGRYALNGHPHQLPNTQPNAGGHVLHGGAGALSHRAWRWRVMRLDDGSAQVIFSIVSSDGDNGYVGELSVEVAYTLNLQQQLTLDYRANTNVPTLCNLTHHSYFNLSGNRKRRIDGHLLQIDADAVCAMDERLLVNGDEWQVAGSDFDYRLAHPLADALNSSDYRLRAVGGLDHYFLLNHSEDFAPDTVQATLYDPVSGRRLKVNTNQPCAVLYTHNGVAGERLRSDMVGECHDALCIETQRCPHRPYPNGDHFARLLPDETYHQRCVYAFDCV